MQQEVPHLDALKDIRQMMKRSSKFLSLSGLSGVAAGIWALIGAYIAHQWINDYAAAYNSAGYTPAGSGPLKFRLLVLAAAVLIAALSSAFYFTWRRASKSNLPVWDYTSRQLAVNMLIPLVTGGLLILAQLQNNHWQYAAALSLIFYGLALVNGSKYTVSDIRYLGICQIILGLINTQFTGYSLYFWAAGFGILHIVYGFVMWWKNERPTENKA